jgi:hypothetical protein
MGAGCALFTLLDVAKKHMSTSPNVQPHVMCSTPIQKAATAPCQLKLRLLSPWLHMPVAKTSEALSRNSNKFVMTTNAEADFVQRELPVHSDLGTGYAVCKEYAFVLVLRAAYPPQTQQAITKQAGAVFR